MKSHTATVAGSASRWTSLRLSTAALCAALLVPPGAFAEVYRYRDDSGQWVFSDRRPADEREFERAQLPVPAPRQDPVKIVRDERAGGAALIALSNAPYPVEVAAWLVAGENVGGPRGSDTAATAVLPPGGSAELLRLEPVDASRPWSFSFESGYVPGDPAALADETYLYRPPFASAQAFPITQAWPDELTHDTPDSRHAVDIAMPEGTGVFAARDGLVVDVAYSNFVGGMDRQRFGRQANLVRVLHDDGSFALYAHLSWDSIRVSPGDRVRRGQLLAASGNTGFTSGPHLHFVVQRNAGLQTLSVPLRFDDGYGGSITPRRGELLRNP